MFEKFKIVREHFLGDKSKIDVVVNAFMGWRPVREKAIALMREGRGDDVAVGL